MAEITFGAAIEAYLCIGQTKVPIKIEYSVAEFRQGHGKVDGKSGFTDTSFTAGDSD
ncbi:MAG: hypothetical protein PsegKO_34150 [Pseudohongiellaceae bacterium]